ncbi:N-ethylammeline chlorohydrolase [Desulfosarcina ovata subsp. sediminis]|uniref:5-methylthioadenosine/S-adenosylhomocysteine deaminase n=1 Tax=Desulfosarcina ovata subsp. sediminis TaxID=885957 RepID=A0A5K7ZX93_9BACT|nr:amidohydrolase [Desulfosarcina ovata]BBO84730.1 N-ethylammeline chlorohydrolase [Desulfosarcina ovata subsp. sediminis]
MTGSVDLLITNGIVMTMGADNRIVDNGAVAVCGDAITAVGPAGEFAALTARETIDAGGGIIMPGLVNTHTHAAMTLFRGLADDLPLMTWLNDHIFPAEALLDPQKVQAGTLLGCTEMILSGTTCFCDMYLFEGAVAEAARTAGLRAVVGEVLYDFPSPNYGPIENGFAYTCELIDRWRDDPLVSIAVEPHSPYLCAPDLLTTAAGIARDNRVPLVIHLSETRSEVADIRKKYGLTPVQHLADLGVLGENLLACHCVILDEKDIDLLQRHEVKVAHNPESNMKLASGIAPVAELVARGVCVGLGTDGCSSNNNLDLFAEMDMAAKLHKASRLDPTVLDATTVLRMATIEGARALGLDGITGSIETDKKADIIVIDTRKPHLTPMYHPASHLVYAVGASDVSATVVGGRVLMKNRRLRNLDIEKIMADARQIADEIRGH